MHPTSLLLALLLAWSLPALAQSRALSAPSPPPAILSQASCAAFAMPLSFCRDGDGIWYHNGALVQLVHACATGQVCFAQSDSLPSVTATGDLNTGIGFPTAGDIVTLWTGGAERARVDSAGRVGVNDTTPDAMVDIVNNNAAQPILRLEHASTPTGDYLQIGTAGSTTGDVFAVGSDGKGITIANGHRFRSWGGNVFTLEVNGSSAISYENGNGLRLHRDNGGILFGEGASVPILLSDGNHILAQRNGTNAQTFRAYNTRTDASNYERVGLNWSGNVFTLRTEHAGTGVARALALGTGNMTRLTIATDGQVSLEALKTTGSATGKAVVCVDVSTGQLFASSSGTECLN